MFDLFQARPELELNGGKNAPQCSMNHCENKDNHHILESSYNISDQRQQQVKVNNNIFCVDPFKEKILTNLYFCDT